MEFIIAVVFVQDQQEAVDVGAECLEVLEDVVMDILDIPEDDTGLAVEMFYIILNVEDKVLF